MADISKLEQQANLLMQNVSSWETNTLARIGKRIGKYGKWYPNEKTIDFEIEPANDEALKVLGKFYAYGNYGGVGCLELPLVARA